MPQTAVNKAANFKSLVQNDHFQQTVREIAPRFADPERLLKIALISASRNPKIYECTKPSILGALMAAAELGLEPSGITGEGYLIPYKNRQGQLELQFQPGYKGLRKNAYLADPNLVVIESKALYENDEIDIDDGDTPHVRIKPNLWNRGKFMGVVAWAKYRDGSMKVERPMTVEDIDKIRNRSRAKSDGPWVSDYVEMARKTIEKRLCKRLKTDDTDLLAKTLAHDDQTEYGEGPAVTKRPPRSSADALYESLSEGMDEAAPDAEDAEFEEVAEEDNKGKKAKPKSSGKKNQEPEIPGEAKFAEIRALCVEHDIAEGVVIESVSAPVEEWGESEIDDILFGFHKISQGETIDAAFPKAKG